MLVTALPDESQMLSVEGYHLHIAGPNHEGWELYLYHQVDGGFMQHRLGRIVKPRVSSWGYNPETRHKFNWVMPPEMGPRSLRAMSEALYHIAKLIEAADEGIKDQIAAAEKARAEREERYRIERERREAERAAELAKVAEIYELVRWLEGQKFRLRRRGMRATVFGTIDRVNEHGMNTTSEKNVPMHITFRELEKLEIKYEDEKRYTLIYERKEEPAHA